MDDHAVAGKSVKHVNLGAAEESRGASLNCPGIDRGPVADLIREVVEIGQQALAIRV